MTTALAVAALLLAGVPASMALINLPLLRRPAPAARDRAARPAASVLIPARNEERSIERAVEAARASRDVDVEVVVMDDQSTDATASVVRRIAARDPRVRLLAAPELPDGWCGKQHACHALAGEARHPVLVFVDADVRLAPDAVTRLVDFLDVSGADLASGIPRQETKSFLEKLVVPLIHFVLVGFLPIPGMRRSTRPAFAAGCGQLMVARASAYRQAGGHAAIRASRHDGVTLPRAFRAADKRTDLFDATRLASCRMYRNASEVWNGFAKNATEGMASPGAILPWTALLFGGQVLPLPLLAATAIGSVDWALASAALAAGYVTRAALAVRYRQSLVSLVLHPLGVVVVLAIQWYALGRALLGRELAWKGRVPAAG